jgi:hypothetical protein
MPYAPTPTLHLTDLTDRDLLKVERVAPSRYSVVLVLAPAARPTTQTDDMDERLVHAARFGSFAAAMRLAARIRRAGSIDVSRWLWTPREHGRFVAPPVATAYDVEAS